MKRIRIYNPTFEDLWVDIGNGRYKCYYCYYSSGKESEPDRHFEKAHNIDWTEIDFNKITLYLRQRVLR